MLPQQYCLRWRYHHSNLQSMFTQLLDREAFCDVTLACEGRTIKAHKIVLSACSSFFDSILSEYEEKDPILIMKDVKYCDIKCIVEFMYKGEINVEHCHLATLLKTAEELKIKGLAEVSWKDEDGEHSSHSANCETSNGSSTNLTVHAALQNVSTVMEDVPSKEMKPSPLDANKRKRGRPPIDDYDYTQAAKLVHTRLTSDDYSNDAPSPENHSAWLDDGVNCDTDAGDVVPQLKVKPDFKIKMEYQSHDESDGNEQTEVPQHRNDIVHPAKHYQGGMSATTMNNSMAKASCSTTAVNSGSSQPQQQSSTTTSSTLPAGMEKDWPDVIKMNDYLNTGRRQQFWEEPFTKRVMDAIKHKNLEMKFAAELLGVSYGTLYGRYRDAYGCLKHPYRIKDFWSEQASTDIVSKLKRKEISFFRAADQLNVTPQTLSNYLISMAVMDNDATPSGSQASCNDAREYEEIEWEDDHEIVTPDVLYQQMQSASSAAVASNSVLANCPDITIIKREKYDMNNSRMNNNSDHSDSTH